MVQTLLASPRGGGRALVFAENPRQMRLIGKAEAIRNCGDAQVGVHQKFFDQGDALFLLPLKWSFARGLLEGMGEPAFREAHSISKFIRAQPSATA